VSREALRQLEKLRVSSTSGVEVFRMVILQPISGALPGLKVAAEIDRALAFDHALFTELATSQALIRANCWTLLPRKAVGMPVFVLLTP
jgi:hypothetical protein